MADSSDQFQQFWKRIVRFISGGTKDIAKIRIPGGVVGKLSAVLIFVCVSVAIGVALIVRAVPQVSVALIGMCLIALVVLVVLIMGWRMIKFADEHPHAALFEGAELLLHEQLKLGMKEQPTITDNPSRRIESSVVQRGLPAVESEPNSPDQPEVKDG